MTRVIVSQKCNRRPIVWTLLRNNGQRNHCWKAVLHKNDLRTTLVQHWPTWCGVKDTPGMSLCSYIISLLVCSRRLKHSRSTHMPFLRGRSLVRIILKSGRSSGFSAQHSTRQSRTKLKLFSSNSSCGLVANDNITVYIIYRVSHRNIDDNEDKNIQLSNLQKSTVSQIGT